MTVPEPTRELLEQEWAARAKPKEGESYDPAFWMSGQAGQANVVTYNGEDVRGVLYIPDRLTRLQVIALHNEAVRKDREDQRLALTKPTPKPAHDWDKELMDAWLNPKDSPPCSTRPRSLAPPKENPAVTDARAARADRYRNNVPTQGTIPLGSLVETETGACLIVVAHYPDCDGSPLYALSHTPTPLMFTSPYEYGKVRECLRRLVVLGYTGDGLTVVDGPERTYAWLTELGYYKEGQWIVSPFCGYNTNGERND